MPKETIASVREEMGALLADAQERADRHAAAYADAIAALRKEQTAHAETEKHAQELLASNRRMAAQLEMLRGYIEAKIPYSEREDISARMQQAIDGETNGLFAEWA